MSAEKNSQSVFLRTYDLPDIHFVGVSDPDNDSKQFTAIRVPAEDEIDSIALNRWFEQSKLKDGNFRRRDCWLEIDGKVYMLWGTSVLSRKPVNSSGANEVSWKFRFSEMKVFDKSSNLN